MRLMTMLLGILLLASSALFAAPKEGSTDKEKKAAAGKDAKSANSTKAKANKKSSGKEQNDPFLDKKK